LLRSSMFNVRFWMFAFILLLTTQVPQARAQLKQYDSRYYTIYTDIDADEEKEAAIRMTRMAEEYHERTKSFAGVIRNKFPFYLYRSRDDYYNAGGPPGSAGVFISAGADSKLMAIAGRHLEQDTWHVVQHEGFHQFAHAVIGGHIPIWLDEGLAEYFGESIFTGDGFVTGIVPPWREQRLKEEITTGQLKALSAMMELSPDQWSAQLNIKNYDQAWSMVHFLVHGDDGKYADAFAQCISEVSQGKTFSNAWRHTIGPADGFEARWKDWWTAQPESPTRALYARAAVATVTSFVARASMQKQTFTGFDDFQAAAEADKLQISPDDWLPPALIKNTLRLYGALPDWDIIPGPNKRPIVTLTVFDGTKVTGSFTFRNGKVDQVNVDIDDMVPVLKSAHDLADTGKKSAARTIVLAAIKRLPKSPMIPNARAFLQTNR
jgi:hypothetical protein